MAGEDLTFPRLVYRGAPDTLGQGTFAHPETGELVGETTRCEDAADWAAKQKQGWRLTRDLDEGAAAEEANGEGGEAKGKKGKK